MEEGVYTCGAIGIFLQSGSYPCAKLSDLTFVLESIVQKKDGSPVFLVTNNTADGLGKQKRRGRKECVR